MTKSIIKVSHAEVVEARKRAEARRALRDKRRRQSIKLPKSK